MSRLGISCVYPGHIVGIYPPYPLVIYPPAEIAERTAAHGASGAAVRGARVRPSALRKRSVAGCKMLPRLCAGVAMSSRPCACPSRRLVWTTVGTYGDPFPNSRRQLREQCVDCGRLFGESVAHSRARADTPNVDTAALQRSIAATKAHWQRELEAWQEKRAAEQRARRLRYEQYLQSDEWASRRELVLQRANYLCEGCGLDRATEVHHLSYDHIGQEFLWELVAVCRRCHAEWHGQAATGDQVAKQNKEREAYHDLCTYPPHEKLFLFLKMVQRRPGGKSILRLASKTGGVPTNFNKVDQ